MARRKTWWLYLLLVIGCGIIVTDHLLVPNTEALSIQALDLSYERSGGKRWHTRSEIVNAHVLSLSDGSALQAATVNDWIAVGDTIELQRTAMLNEPLRFRKKHSRVHDWQVVDSNLPDHRPYPYIVFICALLLLFPWPEGPWRWSLTAALVFVLFGWFMTLIGTGVLARFYQWF
ncbi:MAG: hypothetical protein IPJ76_05905 [Flavobacteriales bacterium]|nr:MAG: hypothetical protein IPJ76_05905 [Flavobacteriales bacterium]